MPPISLSCQSVQIFCPFLYWVICFHIIELKCSLCLLDLKPYKIGDLHPDLTCLFILLTVVFKKKKKENIFNFTKSNLSFFSQIAFNMEMQGHIDFLLFSF